LVDRQQVKLSFIPHVQPVNVELDPRQLKQVVINLAINAIQAMDGVGDLIVRHVVRQRYHLGTYRKIVEMRFEDTGPGIDSKNIAQLFVPFYTTKERGTGLGLSISQRIVEQWVGDIELQKNDKDGAIFSVNLPIVETNIE